MKANSRLFDFSILLLACAAPLLAQNSPSSAGGRINYDSAGAPATIQFRAGQHNSALNGEITFDGNVETPPGVFTAVSVTVTVDCLAVFGNRAAMSGPITASSQPELAGSRSLLAVEDNGQGKNSPPDRFTWFLISAADCQTFPLATAPLQEVPGGHVHVKASNAPF